MLAGLAALCALVIPAVVSGHSERPSFFPNHFAGKLPMHRSRGPALVVCNNTTRKKIRKTMSRRSGLYRKDMRLLARCRKHGFSYIQAAVNAAHSGDRILILPGVYTEMPSRQAPYPDPKCSGDYTTNDDGAKVPTYDYQRKCPNSQNLIAITGDTNGDRVCDQKCNLQIEGMGKRPGGVLIDGGRSKLNLIRADRADGIYLRNFTTQFSDFNNIYVHESNGFVVNRIITRWSREYGILSFTSDNGLYANIEAYGNGDSGVYPGAGPEGHCKWYGIEITHVNSHDNTLGYSGTAGNGVYVHDSKFHDNAVGMVTDSFVPGHPGMPQDCAKWENNDIYSNNKDIYNSARDEYCKKPPPQRDPKVVCPSFQGPVGTGMLIAGGDSDIVRGNRVWDNWRGGIRLFWVPSAVRGDTNPADTYDTSNDNQFTNNVMGVRPDGTRDPNGKDFQWDEEGSGNCWSGNKGPGGAATTNDVLTGLPDCPKGSTFSPGNPAKQGFAVPCATWDPQTNTDPPGCDWFTQPPEPK